MSKPVRVCSERRYVEGYGHLVYQVYRRLAAKPRSCDNCMLALVVRAGRFEYGYKRPAWQDIIWDNAVFCSIKCYRDYFKGV